MIQEKGKGKQPEYDVDKDLAFGCAVDQLEISLQGIARIVENNAMRPRPYAPVSVACAIEAALDAFLKQYDVYCGHGKKEPKGSLAV